MPQATEPIIRPATRRDLDAILRLRQRYCRFEGIAFSRAAARRAILALLDRAAFGRLLVLAAAGELVGYVALGYGYSLEFGGRDGFVDELYIDRGRRGRGLGRRLLLAALGQGRRDGVRAIHLETGRANRRAQRFYASLGFRLRRRFVLMSRSLGAYRRAQSAIQRDQPKRR